MPFWSSRRDAAADTFRIFYASDLHGSDLAWRKFLSAGRVYKAQALIMGGDLTGKAIVPIVENGDGATAEFQGQRRTLATEAELAGFEESVRTNGFYPYRCDAQEVQRLAADQDHLDAVFRQLMTDTLDRWVALADSRLADSDVELFVMPGNDDEWYVDECLRGPTVKRCDGERVQVGPYEMFSLGWSTTTPWDTPRETTEDELWQKIVELTKDADGFDRAIFNFHEPPIESGLDWGPALTQDLVMVKQGGEPKQVPIGSASVRRAIEELQPLLALHGHVHESRGTTRIGRTLCVNPGSRYAEGVVDGAIVTLAGDEVRSHQLVTG